MDKGNGIRRVGRLVHVFAQSSIGSPPYELRPRCQGSLGNDTTQQNGEVLPSGSWKMLGDGLGRDSKERSEDQQIRQV